MIRYSFSFGIEIKVLLHSGHLTNTLVS